MTYQLSFLKSIASFRTLDPNLSCQFGYINSTTVFSLWHHHFPPFTWSFPTSYQYDIISLTCASLAAVPFPNLLSSKTFFKNVFVCYLYASLLIFSWTCANQVFNSLKQLLSRSPVTNSLPSIMVNSLFSSTIEKSWTFPHSHFLYMASGIFFSLHTFSVLSFLISYFLTISFAGSFSSLLTLNWKAPWLSIQTSLIAP